MYDACVGWILLKDGHINGAMLRMLSGQITPHDERESKGERGGRGAKEEENKAPKRGEVEGERRKGREEEAVNYVHRKGLTILSER